MMRRSSRAATEVHAGSESARRRSQTATGHRTKRARYAHDPGHSSSTVTSGVTVSSPVRKSQIRIDTR